MDGKGTFLGGGSIGFIPSTVVAYGALVAEWLFSIFTFCTLYATSHICTQGTIQMEFRIYFISGSIRAFSEYFGHFFIQFLLDIFVFQSVMW